MDTGLLWFDDDPGRKLEDKVKRAATYYKNKFGCAPDLCFVHPSMFGDNGNGQAKDADGVEIRVGRAVLPHHLWVGVSDDGAQKAGASSRS